LAVRRLSADSDLSEFEKNAVRNLEAPRQEFAKGAQLVGHPTTGFHFLLDGWACQMRVTSGHRQIFALILPGDVIGPLPGEIGQENFEWIALTKVVTIDATELAATDADGISLHPGIIRGFAQSQKQAHARLYDHLVRLGSRRAYESISHLFVELYVRQAQVGLTSGARFSFPIGQESLGDLLGMSEVHVNRTLTRLKEDGHLVSGTGWFSLPRLRELAATVGYPLAIDWPASSNATK
jgi:CRP-like cAMP-binding protein